MFNCLKKKEPKSKTVFPARPPIPGVSTNHIALIVGHNMKKQGATNYLDESEWVFNSRITKKLQAKLSESGIKSTVIFRPINTTYSKECRAAAERAEEMGCTHAILFHFNDAGRGAKGVEVLIGKTATKEDNEWADVVTDMLNERYGFVERRDDGVDVIGTSHNGAGMVYAVGRKGIVTCLVEPCFGGYRTNESALIFEEEDKYVNVLHDSIIKAWSN